ncbi:MAG: hypothetical protein ACLRSW_04350 [Christensenellaceae bacterium]
MVMDPGYNAANRKRIEENAALLQVPVEIFETDVFAASSAAGGDSPCYSARMRRGYLYAKANWGATRSRWGTTRATRSKRR